MLTNSFSMTCGGMTPPWLEEEKESWPVARPKQENLSTLNSNIAVNVVNNEENKWDLFERFSTRPKLLRALVYALRFIKNCRFPKERKLEASLSIKEIDDAKIACLKLAQKDLFEKEISNLTKGRNVPLKSSIIALIPLLDENGLLKVGGRIKNSQIPTAAKFPFVVPQGRLATLLIRHSHAHTLHGGIQPTLRVLRRQYCVISARRLVGNCINKCVTCARFRAELQTQKMGDLPAVRTQPARPFAMVGVDYAGPFEVRNFSGGG